MVINEDKTKFMVIHGEECDILPFTIGEIIMQHCLKYIYLCATFTADGSMLSSLREHAKDKQKHLNKLIIFHYKNTGYAFFCQEASVGCSFYICLIVWLWELVGCLLCRSWENIYISNKISTWCSENYSKQFVFTRAWLSSNKIIYKKPPKSFFF